MNNLNDLEKIRKENIIVLGKVGKRKKEEILKKADEKRIKFSNLKIKNKENKK